jgi:hypothetical protein
MMMIKPYGYMVIATVFPTWENPTLDEQIAGVQREWPVIYSTIEEARKIQNWLKSGGDHSMCEPDDLIEIRSVDERGVFIN